MNRATIGLCLVALGIATTFLSDLLIRTASVPGTDPTSYDVVGTTLLVVGGITAVFGETSK